MHRGSHYAKEMERANWDNVHVITLFCGLHFFHPPSPCFFFTVLFSRQSSFFSFPRLIRCFLSAQFRARVDIARFLIINIFHRDIYIVYLFYSSSLVWLFALNYYLRWTRFNGTRFDGIRFFRFIYLFFFCFVYSTLILSLQLFLRGIADAIYLYDDTFRRNISVWIVKVFHYRCVV